VAAGVLVNLLIKIFILTIFGYALKKWKIITQELQEGLNSLLLKAILPVSVFMSSQNEYSMDAVNNMMITAVVALAYYIIALLIATLVSKKLSISMDGKKVFITMSVFANVAFIGYPIMQELYGNEGVLLAVVYNIFFQLIFFTYGISLLSGKKQMKLHMLYKNPVVLSSLLSVILFIFKIKIPKGIS
jgi:predicted permease